MKKSFDKHKEELEKLVEQSFKELTAQFANLSDLVRKESVEESVEQVDKVYRGLLNLSRDVNEGLRKLADTKAPDGGELDKLRLEIKRLETLYGSGILFASETERGVLLRKAIEVVSKELSADAGYIVFMSADNELEDAYGLNMNAAEVESARDMSMTVIRQTIEHSQTLRVDDTQVDHSLATKNSIMHLDIQAVLCVPLLLEGNVLGAVYLDRRSESAPFTVSDQAFLLAFAQQISRGLKVSEEISSLEGQLVKDAALTLNELREKFKSEEIIGSGSGVFELLRMGLRIAPTEVSLLILGESGTGKELFANAIHRNSRRAQGPFVAINCGAIPKDLLESELFGYEQGAFTGARGAKPGKIETADGGTLFLDEIGEMDAALQTRLLRVLQQREVERLGSVKPRKIDIRLLAATNRDLASLVSEGRFREDLYYRLKVIELTLPPLRERREDIAELAAFFLNKHGADTGLALSDEALKVLEGYDWPGNIRELENVMQRCIVLCQGEKILGADLPPELLESSPAEEYIAPGLTLAEAEKAFRRQHILKALQKSKSKSEVARMLGVNRTYLYKLLDELDIQTD